MQQRGIKTVKQFADRYHDINPLDPRSLDPSILSRLLAGKSKPNAETIKKIAVLVMEDKDATEEELWNRVLEEKYADQEAGIIRVGTGFTTWSSFVLSMINLQHDPRITEALRGIKFVFCNDGREGKPYWIQSKGDLEKLRLDPGRFPHKFIGNDLQRMLNGSVIDCAIMLRPTFEAMEFPLLEKRPMLLSRILVGNGTHMYVIMKKDIAIALKYDKNVNISIKNARDIMEAKDKFCRIISNKKVRTVTIGNKTINDDKVKLLRDPQIQDALTLPKGEDVFNNIGNDEEYFNHLQRIKDLIVSGAIDVLIVIAFAPVNHIIYRDIIDRDPSGLELRYVNFNLSKMVEEKASYGLYVRWDAVRNLTKLKKLKDFLNAMRQFAESAPREDLIADISSQLADLYYNDEPVKKGDGDETNVDNISKVERMTYDLGEIEYSNRSLPLINLMVEMLEEK